ncbi:hypothetical protein YC2023_075554 [Brassica napus]
MGPRSVNPKIRKPEKPDPNANGYPNAQAYLHIRGERSGIRSGSDRSIGDHPLGHLLGHGPQGHRGTGPDMHFIHIHCHIA